jgi:acetylornithine/N-succinyldiaminopimelate aminotransferase
VLIFDEVQTGNGRTGTFYAFEGEGVVPDIVTLAKGLGGGVPIGAMLASEEVARGFEPGSHASTFGGNPFATAAALYVQTAIDEQGLVERSHEMGAHLGSALLRLAERRRPRTRGARGRGLLQGIVIDGDPAEVVAGARARGLLVSLAGSNVVRLVPPLIVSRAEIDEAVAILDDVLGGGR